ncbi:MAG: hypothetical protein DSY80_01185, partial [Desulfocapsa sp.]
SLLGDPTRISQVLVNLVSNAIKFTGSNGEVSVFCERVKETDREVYVKFSVKDGGIGISAEQQARIFEAFSQADSSTTRKFGGTGLGLSISSKLVSAMGGHLEIKSELGEGATFFFTLALKRNQEVGDDNKPNFQGMRVGLLLPKHNITRQVDTNLETYLRYLGTDFTIYDEEEVFVLLKNNLPDILFVDQYYNRREGEIERALALDIPVVLMASNQDKDGFDLVSGRLAAVINKPLNYSKILKAMQKVSGNAQETPVFQEPEISFTNLNILVAEDNTINQKLIRTTLQKIGSVITIASNGEEAVSLRKKHEYDLIFMDIQMPVMNGVEATEAILEYEKKSNVKHIPIIALTANALRGDREKFLKAGMDDYTPKPINLSLLKEIMREYCPDKVSTSDERAHLSDDTMAPEPTSDAIATGSADDPSVPPASKRILIYNNHSLSAAIQQKTLESEGYTCTIVDSEIKFLDRLEHEAFQSVIMKEANLTKNDCFAIDAIVKKGVQKVLYFSNSKSEKHCEHTEGFSSLQELMRKMEENRGAGE